MSTCAPALNVLMGSHDGQRMDDWKMVDTMINNGLWDVYNKCHTGITAEHVGKQEGITRDMQDALALVSQQKAAAAQEAGKLKHEIVPVTIPQRKGEPVLFDANEFIKKKTNSEALASLKPAFDKAGSVTARNASGVNDGAVAITAMKARKARNSASRPWRASPASLPWGSSRSPLAWASCPRRNRRWPAPAGTWAMWICSS